MAGGVTENIAADLFEATDRADRSSSFDELTARASGRDSPQREPRTRRDLELPKLCSSKQNATDQAPTLDILADCLDDIHQIRCRTRLASASKQSRWHIHRSRENEPDGNTTKIARRESLRNPKWNRISEEEQRAAVARPSPHQHASIAGHEQRNTPWTRLNPTSSRLSPSNRKTRESDGLQGRPDIDAVAAETFVKFEREAENWKTIFGATASPYERQAFAAHLSSEYLCSSLDLMPSSTIVGHLRREVAHRIDLLATVVEYIGDGRGENATVNDSEFALRCETNVPGVDDYQPSDGHDADDESFATEEEETNPEASRSTDSLRETMGPPVYDVAGAISAPSHESRVSEMRTSLLCFAGSGNEASTANSRDNGGVHCLSSVPFKKTSEMRDGNPRETSRLTLAAGKTSRLAHAGAPREKTVRFLLGDGDVGDKAPNLVANRSAGTGSELKQHGSVSRQVVVDDKRKVCWTCEGCGKRNGESAVVCSICGRRGDNSHADNSHSNKVVSQGQTRWKRVDPGDASQALGTVCERSIPRGRIASPGGSERVEAKGSLRGDKAAYDLSSFAKMKQTTEKAVTARLSLTAEIKSLLSLIRGRRG